MYSVNSKDIIPKSVLVICLGNICRSPVAEYLFKYYISQSQSDRIQKIKVDSAGLNPVLNQMSPHSAQYLHLMNIETIGFQPKKISLSFLNKHDLILVMEENQKKEILKMYSNYTPKSSPNQTVEAPKIFTLSEAAGSKGDIDDPYGDSWEGYKKILDQIHNYVRSLINKWENLN
ncbi:arsenate reductase/protein-tyrosine-phosphatase family protein [Candidatus Harpocratesius sp.]